MFRMHTFRDGAKDDFQLCGFSEIEGRRKRSFCDSLLQYSDVAPLALDPVE